MSPQITPERDHMPTYRKNVDTMFHTVQHTLDELSGHVKNTHVAFLNLNHALEVEGQDLSKPDAVMISGTIASEYLFLRGAMYNLEVAMRETMSMTETEDKEVKK